LTEPISITSIMLFLLLIQAFFILDVFASFLPAVNLIGSRKVLGPFTVNSTGTVQGRLGIEHRGLGFVLSDAPNRPIDDFFLNGNILIAEDRNGSCYVHPDTNHLYCEDVPEDVPHAATKFRVSREGNIIFNGTTDWLLCPYQIPNTYVVYYNSAKMRKPSPYCKDAQLKVDLDNKKKRFISDDMQLHNDLKYCPFVLSVVGGGEEDEIVRKLSFGPFIVSGRSLMTSKDYKDYCFVDSITRQLLCRDESDPALMTNWQTMHFALSENGTIKHGTSDQWFVCQDKTGSTIGPFDSEKKEGDPACTTKLQAVQLKAQHPAKIEQCHEAKWSPKGTKTLNEVFAGDSKKHEKRNKKEQRAPTCPTNLVDTLFKSPSLVLPIVLKNATQLPGNEEKIVILPTQSTAVNFFSPFTTPYFGKTCALIFLTPHIYELSIQPQAAPAAVEVTVLEKVVDELTTWSTIELGHSLGSKKISKDIKSAEENKDTILAKFPCQAGSTMSFLLSSKGGLNLIVRQAGVPNESGLHIVPCSE
jgi:hypothetical protein